MFMYDIMYYPCL